MKRSLFLVLFVSILFPVLGQDYYKAEGDLVADDSITFRVRLSGRLIFMENINNTLGNAKEVYLDGTPYDDEFGDENFVTTLPGSVKKAFTETFTKEEYEQMRNSRDCDMDICYVISPLGDIMEVFFAITGVPLMRAFPPSKYALLEKNLKKYVKCTVSPNGRKLKYIHTMSFANFSVMDLYYPGDPQPGVKDPQFDAKPLTDGKPGWVDPTDGKTRED